MASVGLNTIAVLDIWTVRSSRYRVPAVSVNARIRRVEGKENTKCHRKEASAGRDSVPLFSWCVGAWFSGRLVPSCYLYVFGSFWGERRLGLR